MTALLKRRLRRLICATRAAKLSALLLAVGAMFFGVTTSSASNSRGMNRATDCASAKSTSSTRSSSIGILWDLAAQLQATHTSLAPNSTATPDPITAEGRALVSVADANPGATETALMKAFAVALHKDPSRPFLAIVASGGPLSALPKATTPQSTVRMVPRSRGLRPTRRAANMILNCTLGHAADASGAADRGTILWQWTEYQPFSGQYIYFPGSAFCSFLCMWYSGTGAVAANRQAFSFNASGPAVVILRHRCL